MAARFHFVASQQVRALAEGTSTEADLAPLISGEVSKCLAMLALIVRDAEAGRHAEADAAAAGWRLLSQVQREAPRAVTELLRYPSVAAWASRLTRDDASPGRLAVIAFAAAVRGGICCSVTLPPSVVADGSVHLPSLGTVLLPRGLRQITVRHRDGGTELSGREWRLALPRRLDRDAACWHALPVVSGEPGGATRPAGGTLRLVIDDADPYRLPGPVRLTGRLSPTLLRQWRRHIAGGWRLLARYHPRTAAEIASLIRSVVPLAADEGDMRSLTSRQAFGSIGMSLPVNDVQMALTLAHEVQHAKLSALMDLVPLVTEPAPGRYYAPWRPDPRPLASLLQGMYAHLEVARFWRRRRDVAPGPAEAWQANVEFAKWRSACAQVADSVRARPGLTSCGIVFVDGMINALRTWQNDSIPPSAQAQADREICEHKRKWDARHRDSREAASAHTGTRRKSCACR